MEDSCFEIHALDPRGQAGPMPELTLQEHASGNVCSCLWNCMIIHVVLNNVDQVFMHYRSLY